MQYDLRPHYLDFQLDDILLKNHWKGESNAHANGGVEEEVVRNGGDRGGWSGEATQKETTVFYHALLVFSD